MAAYISFQPTDHFNTLLYTGDASASQAFTGVGFKPGCLWIKMISETKEWSNYDAPRGVEKTMRINNRDAQSTDASGLISFDADGFTLGSNSHVAAAGNYVSYNWLGAASGAANSDGGITTTISYVNSTAEMSFATYAGGDGFGASTIGHGLSVAPDMVIIKRLEDAGHGWAFGSDGMAASDAWDYAGQSLDSTGVRNDGVAWWNDTYPTSSVVAIGGDSWNNLSGKNFVMYCFANKRGFFKTGGFEGNLNADGPFIYTGFKPAFLLIKDHAQTNQWTVLDNKRNNYGPANPRRAVVATNSDAAQWDETDGIDFLSNGFKIRESASWANNSGYNMVYAAFAEFPFVSSNSIPVTAE